MSKFIENLDSKVNPDTGNLLRKIFKIITLVMLCVVLPAIAITVGSFAVVGTDVSLAI